MRKLPNTDHAGTRLMQEMARHVAGKAQTLASLRKLKVKAAEIADAKAQEAAILRGKIQVWFDAGMPDDKAQEVLAQQYVDAITAMDDAKRAEAYAEIVLQKAGEDRGGEGSGTPLRKSLILILRKSQLSLFSGTPTQVTVKQHTAKTKSGKVVTVKQHTATVRKVAEEAPKGNGGVSVDLERIRWGGKVPYEMTAAEFKQHPRTRQMLKPTGVSIYSGAGKPSRAANRVHYDHVAGDYHKSEVNDALRDGKTVPAQVMADYPDLKPPSAPDPAAEYKRLGTPDDVKRIEREAGMSDTDIEAAHRGMTQAHWDKVLSFSTPEKIAARSVESWKVEKQTEEAWANRSEAEVALDEGRTYRDGLAGTLYIIPQNRADRYRQLTKDADDRGRKATEHAYSSTKGSPRHVQAARAWVAAMQKQKDYALKYGEPQKPLAKSLGRRLVLRKRK